VTMPFYASPEQLMRERSELARKGIARGRSVVVLSYDDGVLFVAENHSSTLHKVSEIYDRIGFAAVGRYNEFENMRMAGIRMADLRGYSNDRRDVTGRSLANAYAQTLGSIFTEQLKPFEVELCVAEVGSSNESDQLYRITYDGSIFDEPGFVVMGGQTEPIGAAMRESFTANMALTDALNAALRALKSVTTTGPGSGLSSGSGSNAAASAGAGANATGRDLGRQLEVAVLDRRRPRRAFRRIIGAALADLIAGDKTAAPEPEAPAAEPPKDPGAPEPPTTVAPE
jgi:proteasome alpha subunit